MLSKSAAKKFFVIGTIVCSGAFILLTLDTIQRVPGQTNQENLGESAIRGKHLWDKNNCMGCHTIMGEGAYYAPELTKVFERRGAAFIDAMLVDPQAMYPGQRKMQKYDFSEQDRKDIIAFLKWIGEMDLNDFPPKPDLMPMAVAVSNGAAQTGANSGVSSTNNSIAKVSNRPQIFNQMCIACHILQGQGGAIGPALDGIGSRRDLAYIQSWLKDPLKVKPDSKMPKLPLSDADIVELAAFLSQLKEENK